MFSGFLFNKPVSIYNNKTVLNEYIPKNKLESLLQNGIGIFYENDSYIKKEHGFESETQQFEKMLQKFNPKENCYKIKLRNNDHGHGRVKADDNATLSLFHRPTRYSLVKDTYVDIDIVSACQSVFRNIVKANNRLDEFPRLNEYIENRDELFARYQQRYDKPRDIIKKLFTMIGFGGSHKTWYNKFNVAYDNDEFIQQLNQEYYNLSDIIYANNPQIIIDVLKANPTRFVLDTNSESNPLSELNAKKRTVIALYYQDIERAIQETAISYLCQNKGLNLKEIVPCQDGFMILKQYMYSSLCDDISLVVKNVCSMNITFINKPFDDGFFIPEYFDRTIEEKKQKRIEVEEAKKQKRLHDDEKKEENKQKRLHDDLEKQQTKKQKTLDANTEKAAKKFERQLCIDRSKQLKDDMKAQEKEDSQFIPPKENEDDIDWDVSEASFASELKKHCFQNNIMFDGKGKDQIGYYFNCIYWKEIPMHNAELFNHFDALYEYYQEEVEKLVKAHDGDAKYLVWQHKIMYKLKALKSFNTRNNVIKIFKSDNYKSDVKWNQNTNIFVFENCIWSLDTQDFIMSDPNDYMNMSCGYTFNNEYFTDMEVQQSIHNAQEDIKQFINGIVKEENYEYLMKYMASFLKQDNKDETAHFFLGDGRNGKGTLTTLCKNALGSYWGELSTDYYVKSSTNADAPNQNLYNCRNARVLNTSETPSIGINNKPIYFIEDNFKRITGGDAIYARELGTKTTTYFTAGKCLIQLNLMAKFQTLGTSIRERIRIVPFPYTFCDVDDDRMLQNTPSEIKYKVKDKALKEKFNTKIYKQAMILLLFDYYSKYIESFEMTKSIESETSSYFISSSLKPFIEETYITCEDEKVSIEDIAKAYFGYSDRILSVKLLSEQLRECDFKVSKIRGYMYLVGYSLPEDIGSKTNKPQQTLFQLPRSFGHQQQNQSDDQGEEDFDIIPSKTLLISGNKPEKYKLGYVPK